jgi:uncharacterized protein (DUF697 family)
MTNEGKVTVRKGEPNDPNDREEQVESAQRSLKQTLTGLIDDPSLPEPTKIRAIIHLTSLTCAVVASQPIPFADLLILSPIQVVMVWEMSRVMGRPVGKQGAGEIVASIFGVVGWGLFFQQAILGLYKSLMPFLGGFTTIPLVYAATYALGQAAREVLEARRRDQELSRRELRAIARKAAATARKERRDWSLDALRSEIQEWKARADEYEVFKARDAEYAARIRDLEHKLAEEAGELEPREFEDLEDPVPAPPSPTASVITEEEVDEVLEENLKLKEQLDEARKESERIPHLESSLARALDQREKSIRDRLQTCYPSVEFENGVVRTLAKLTHPRMHAIERQLSLLQHDLSKASFRGRVVGSTAEELSFDRDGRFYISRDGGSVKVLRVGAKKSQPADIRWVRDNYPSRA